MPSRIGANLSGATLVGADLTRTFLVYAENLTAQQVRSAENWRKASLPEDLQYLKNLPDPSASPAAGLRLIIGYYVSNRNAEKPL